MQVSFDELLDRASPQQVDFILLQWNRLKAFMKETQVLQMFSDLLKEKSLELLLHLTDEEIQTQFRLAPKKAHTNTSISFNQKKKSQHSQSEKTKNPFEETTKENLQQSKKTLFKELNPQIKERKVMKTQKEKSDFHRMKQEILNSKKEHQEIIKASCDQLVNLLDKSFDIKKRLKVLNRSQIIKQKQRLSKKKFKSNTFDYIQLVDSALYHSSKQHRLRETQIFALLLFLIGGTNKMLLEIMTGEGKSTTVSCLAAILTIMGYSVDIVTTSPLLATRDVEEKKKFYKLMELGVAHNFQENQMNQKKCYADNKIVYGTPHSFQVDILLNDYKKRKTRCRRPFEVLIVDEVDSMFIDQKEQQTLLATTYPGMSELVLPMKIIWNKINSNPIFMEKDGKIKMALALGKDKTVTGEVKVIMEQVIKDIRSQFKNQIIPEWRQGFIEESLEKWIESAIAAAFQYKEKKDYLVRNGKIVPVDYKNNGSLQENVHWGNGLHQFLQIKHGLTVTTEGMISNFISNLGHFDKYIHLYGLTGTLGSNQSKLFLKNTYKAQLFKVPPFQERRLKIQQGVVLYDETEWAKYICKSAFNMIARERSVLILCQTIKEVNLIQIALSEKNIRAKRIQTLMLGEQQIDDNIDCEEIIIATNLAGRGADLKITSTLNERGGLHVIITFMPINSRVEMQGRGRAGRNGYEGSSELAINYVKYCDEIGLKKQSKIIFDNTEISRPQSLIGIRDQIQVERMTKDDDNVRRLRSKDQLFNIYCTAMNEIQDFHENTAKQKALEQQWAMFLKRADNLNLPYDELQEEAIRLTQKLKQNSEGYYNPNHYVSRGIDELIKNKNQNAINYFRKAQDNNNGTLSQILGGLYESCCKINQNKQKKNQKQQIINNLMETKEIIKHRKEMKQGFRVANDIDNANITNFFQQQTENQVKSFQINIREDEFQHNFQPINLEISSPIMKQTEKLKAQLMTMSTGEDRILNGIQNRIQQMIKKYSNLKEGESLRINFRPISLLLSEIEGDNLQNKTALDNLRPEGMYFLPEGVVNNKKKNQIIMWKRVGMFLFGIAQIVVGAIILAKTAGTLQGFAVTMMMEGAKSCFDSIFKPEQLENLTKYFTSKSMNYAFTLATAGLDGIEELGSLSKKGINMFNQMPIGQFLKTSFKNVKQGFGVFWNTDSLERGMDLLKSCGTGFLSNKINLPQMIQDPIRVIQQKGKDIKEEVEKILKEEQKLDKSMESIRNNFSTKISQYIAGCITKLNQNLLLQLKNLNIDSQHLNIVIDLSLTESLKLPEDRSSEAKQLIKLFAEKLNSNDLGSLFANHIGLEKKVKMCLQNIVQNQHYDLIIKNGISNLIKKSLSKVRKDKTTLLKAQQDRFKEKFDSLNSNKKTMTVEVYERQVQNYKKEIYSFKSLVEIHNSFQQKPVDIGKILQMIDNKKGIKEGRIKPAIINSLPVHQYIKEALNKLEYGDCSVSFQQNMQAAIFNIVGNYGLKMINEIYQSTNGSIDQLSKIAKMMRTDS